MQRGISESNELQTRVKQKMIGMANQIYLLADSSKFGVQAFTQVASIHEIDRLITDKNISDELLNQLNEAQIPTTTV